MVSQKGAKVGFLSRIDYGSQGFRGALVRAGFSFFLEEKTNFNILAGGLVAGKALATSMNTWIKEQLDKNRKQADKKNDKNSKPNELSVAEKRKLKKTELRHVFLKKVAEELAELIPAVTVPHPEDQSKKKTLDLFIVTSPAFDGEIGEEVAQRLAELRSDIRIWNKGGDRFPVKYVDKMLWVLAPPKATWMRGDYFSTPVERVIKDKIKQTSQSSPDHFVVGCFGSSVNKPKGELKYSYFSVPVLSRLEETRVNENQIGVATLEFPSNDSRPIWRNRSFKDLVSKELSFVVAPEDATDLQKSMIEVLKTRGAITPGDLTYLIKDTSSDKVQEEMEKLMQSKTFRRVGENWPGLTYEEYGKKYYFDLGFIQHRLKYSPITGPLKEDRIVSFCCLHAGSVETDYQFFINEVPRIILAHNATVLVNAGDIKEGMRHHLDRKGEIIAGMNNTVQEKFAANLVGSVMGKVFKERFNKFREIEKDDISPDKLTDIINNFLIALKNKLGNHDLWETEDGHSPLVVFELTLVNNLHSFISDILEEQKLFCPDLRSIVKSKVTRNDFFELASGLKVSIQHPHMARAKTTSLRPQEMLEFAKRHKCQIAIGGNFHVSENVEEWDMDLGQCVCQQVGTIKHGSNFERNKMKMVDQGVGVLQVFSKDGRIIQTDSVFYGQPQPRPPVDNLDIVNVFVEKLGLNPIK